MKQTWKYDTSLGEARILFKHGKWHAVIGNEFLGGYVAPEQALEDLVGGRTFPHSSGVSTATLGLPGRLSEWSMSRY